MHTFRNITKIYLASGSPRRRDLVTYLGIPFEVVRSESDEHSDLTDPEARARDIAISKNFGVSETLIPGKGEVIISADTSVWLDGRMFGKPADAADAERMLRLLSGRCHKVISGVAIRYNVADPYSGKTATRTDSFSKVTSVSIEKLTDGEIREYVDSGDPLDKAGAYGIQGAFSVHVKGIRGDYNNVVGFPVAAVYEKLKKIDKIIK